MSLSQHVAQSEKNGVLLEKVMLGADLSGLTPLERVTHLTNVCQSLGLNPLTRPIQLMTLKGKLVPYATKDATEQLRNLRNVSITNIDAKILAGGDLYLVIANAVLPNGRSDSSTAVISIKGLNGEDLSNAMMKCETKAKRRLTLSICGLGYIDETEVDSIPGAIKVNAYEEPKTVKQIAKAPEEAPIPQDESVIKTYMIAMQNSKDIEELKNTYLDAMKYARGNRTLAERFVAEKDSCRGKLTVKQFNEEIEEAAFEDIKQ